MRQIQIERRVSQYYGYKMKSGRERENIYYKLKTSAQFPLISVMNLSAFNQGF